MAIAVSLLELDRTVFVAVTFTAWVSLDPSGFRYPPRILEGHATVVAALGRPLSGGGQAVSRK